MIIGKHFMLNNNLSMAGLANLLGKCAKLKKKVCKCAKNVFFSNSVGHYLKKKYLAFDTFAEKW